MAIKANEQLLSATRLFFVNFIHAMRGETDE